MDPGSWHGKLRAAVIAPFAGDAPRNALSVKQTSWANCWCWIATTITTRAGWMFLLSTTDSRPYLRALLVHGKAHALPLENKYF